MFQVFAKVTVNEIERNGGYMEYFVSTMLEKLPIFVIMARKNTEQNETEDTPKTSCI